MGRIEAACQRLLIKVTPGYLIPTRKARWIDHGPLWTHWKHDAERRSRTPRTSYSMIRSHKKSKTGKSPEREIRLWLPTLAWLRCNGEWWVQGSFGGGWGKGPKIVRQISQLCELHALKGRIVWDLNKALWRYKETMWRDAQHGGWCVLSAHCRTALPVGDATTPSKLQGESQCDWPCEELPW